MGFDLVLKISSISDVESSENSNDDKREGLNDTSLADGNVSISV